MIPLIPFPPRPIRERKLHDAAGARQRATKVVPVVLLDVLTWCGLISSAEYEVRNLLLLAVLFLKGGVVKLRSPHTEQKWHNDHCNMAGCRLDFKDIIFMLSQAEQECGRIRENSKWRACCSRDMTEVRRARIVIELHLKNSSFRSSTRRRELCVEFGTFSFLVVLL